jgi:hypothetical protein
MVYDVIAIIRMIFYIFCAIGNYCVHILAYFYGPLRMRRCFFILCLRHLFLVSSPLDSILLVVSASYLYYTRFRGYKLLLRCFLFVYFVRCYDDYDVMMII